MENYIYEKIRVRLHCDEAETYCRGDLPQMEKLQAGFFLSYRVDRGKHRKISRAEKCRLSRDHFVI